MQSETERERDLVQDLITKTNYVLLYEDHALQNLALEQIPLEILSNNASKRAAEIRSQNTNGVGEDDLLILELLQWFKFSFFTWVNAPKCRQCGQDTESRGMVPPTEDELQWGASRVEGYFCTPCQKHVRFPRYNHPKKVLEKKRGRCGEWANCFTLLCRSLGYEARLVYEWGDHVWSEVYSFSQKRWLHCDSCENVCDKPLMYEIGWKKKISYVIAISKDEIQDVTWRYCTNFQEVLGRRTLYRESWLIDIMSSLTKSLQKGLSKERKEFLLFQKVNELVSFLTPPSQKSDEETLGRSSGAQAWREARGECQSTSSQMSHVFRLDNTEISSRYFHLRYNCASDRYTRVSSNLLEINKWNVLTSDSRNIFRKVENDWNTAYIARKEGCPDGLISWKFDFQESGLVIDSLKLNFSSKTFESGVVNVVLHSGTLMVPVRDSSPVTVNEFHGLTTFSLTAELTGGNGPVAWQHAQLFRQPLNSSEYPFEIEIHFRAKSECS